MIYDGTLTLRDEKLYLATFKFLSAESTQIFYKAFYAKNIEDLKTKVHEYLVNHFNIVSVLDEDGNVYYHLDDEVAVQYCGWEEIKSLKQLTSILL